MAAPKRTKRAANLAPKSKSARRIYVERVESALETDPREMSRLDYRCALEEISMEVESRLTAVNEELNRGES